MPRFRPDLRLIILALSTLAVFAAPAWAADPAVPAAGEPGAASVDGPAVTAEGGPAGFAVSDPAAATAAWLARVPPAEKRRSDAYFEGGYWLLLWDFLFTVAALWLILHLGWSAAMRDRADRLAARFRPLAGLRAAIYWLQLFTVLGVLSFPWVFYEDFHREHAYGLSTQTFGAWFGDQMKEFLVGLVGFGFLVSALYAVLRRSRRWWLWGSIVSILFLIFSALIAPVYLDPIFNTYTRLEIPAIRDPILRLARANGIPARDVWVEDASRQTTRVSAHVSGLLGTTRITLNDNLLARASLPEIEAVMGHEMGHYVLHHNYKGIVYTGLLIVLGFAFVRAGFDRAARRFASRWRVDGVGDLAGLPLLMLLFSIYGFALTPITNSVIRIEEAEADLFGLNAARQPDGEAAIALKLGEYRKLDPGPLEEILFFDHPSGRRRIEMAMRWKAENPGGAAP